RSGNACSCGRSVQAGHGASYGPADPRRFHRPRRLSRHHARAASGARRSQVSPLSAAGQDGGCGLARQEIRPRILQILAMRISEALVYGLAVLLGICAGTLEITANDILATALFVLVSTLVLGYLRPRRAWRWIAIVGIFVPLARLAAYLLMHQKPYHAQIWASGLGFVTGIAGSYA